MDIDRRTLLIAAALGATVGEPARADSPPGPKVLRYAFPTAETGMDPARIGDIYSRTLTPHIFEGLYTYDHLARPIKFRPLTAEGMPEVSADFRVWTVRIRPGIYFADDPAFKGRRRELVAQDYVYTFKRFADPANLSPAWLFMEPDGYLGLTELRQRALDTKQPFDYDHEIEGLRAIDRYTVQFKLAQVRPRFIETLAGGDLYGAVAREVVEFYGSQIDAHPVGTGPFKLAQWRRSSLIVLERNPGFRDMVYDAEPAADDAEGQAILKRLKGRKLPMVDRVEISIVEENQPRWLSFLGGQADLAAGISGEAATQAMPQGKLAPHLAKRGIQSHAVVASTGSFFYFNMDDRIVGGYTPEKVALRRAIGLGIDARRIIDSVFAGLAVPLQGPTLPNTSVYDPRYKSEFGDYDPARAKGLLDLYGYKLGEDGWRTMPDGTPLAFNFTRTSAAVDRQITEILTKNMAALGIRMSSTVSQWPEAYKAARSGKLQTWLLGLSAAGPDAVGSYALFDSIEIGSQDFARFKLARMDQIYLQLQSLPDGPERLALFHEADRLAIAYMPYKFLYSRLAIDMTQPQLVGYRRPAFWQDWWQFVDIDHSLVPA